MQSQTPRNSSSEAQIVLISESEDFIVEKSKKRQPSHSSGLADTIEYQMRSLIKSILKKWGLNHRNRVVVAETFKFMYNLKLGTVKRNEFLPVHLSLSTYK